MLLILQRDYVCAADDAVNDSRLELEIPEHATLDEFLAKVMSIDYLQCSSSHRCMAVKSGKTMALVVPDEMGAIYLEDPNSPLFKTLEGSQIDFSFDLSREEARLYGEYRRSKLFG